MPYYLLGDLAAADLTGNAQGPTTYAFIRRRSQEREKERQKVRQECAEEKKATRAGRCED